MPRGWTHLVPCNKTVAPQQTAQYYVNKVLGYHGFLDISTLTEVHSLPRSFGKSHGSYLGRDLNIARRFICRRKAL